MDENHAFLYQRRLESGSVLEKDTSTYAWLRTVQKPGAAEPEVYLVKGGHWEILEEKKKINSNKQFCFVISKKFRQGKE